MDIEHREHFTFSEREIVRLFFAICESLECRMEARASAGELDQLRDDYIGAERIDLARILLRTGAIQNEGDRHEFNVLAAHWGR